MTQSNIKDEITKLEHDISFAQDRIKYLRSICNHPHTITVYDNIERNKHVCLDCDSIVKYSDRNIHPST